MSKKLGARNGSHVPSVDDYLAALPETQREALQHLRKIVASAVPKATQAIWYNMPTFKLDGRPLVCYRASTNHCALHFMSPSLMAQQKVVLKGLDWSGGTVRFTTAKPLPAAVVKKLVAARIKELGPGSGSG